MSIKFKLALPPLIGLFLIILLIETYWKPLQLETAKIAFEKHNQELLILGETGITQHLLDRNLASLYSSIAYIEDFHQNQWQNVTLYRESGKQIYPLLKRNFETTIKDKNFIHIVYPLSVEGTHLGHLELDLDWGNEKLRVIQDIDGIRDIFILMIIISMLLSTLSQYRIIYSPLKRLGGAVNKIISGSYNVDLPITAKDEIGELSSSFKMMMAELAFQKNALDHHSIVSTTDKDGVITYANNKFIDITGYTREELIGKTHRLVKSGVHPPEFYKKLWETITHGDIWHGELCNHTKAGKKYWVNSTIVPFLDKNGAPERYVSIRTDITKQKNIEEQLLHLANHDNLTGLSTRRLCKEYLSSALAVARRNKNKVAVLFIDLDGFKAVNDTLGHTSGDFLLVKVAERLISSIRESDMVSRIGGDEFMIILTNINNHEDAAIVAQNIITVLAIPFLIGGKNALIGASIGISLYPDNEKETEALIKSADEVMYSVKRRGKNNFAFADDV